MPAGIWGGLITLPEGGMAEAREFARRHGFRLLGMQALAQASLAFSPEHPARGVKVPVTAEWLEYDEIALPTPIRRLLRGMLQKAG
ncbi:MAG: hypothetical protein IPP85_01675 [Propionivibrio sp.]|nr:hypothetical protein [Propionivibrio sp.]